MTLFTSSIHSNSFLRVVSANKILPVWTLSLRSFRYLILFSVNYLSLDRMTSDDVNKTKIDKLGHCHVFWRSHFHPDQRKRGKRLSTFFQTIFSSPLYHLFQNFKIEAIYTRSFISKFCFSIFRTATHLYKSIVIQGSWS